MGDDGGLEKEAYVPKFASSASSISILERGRAGALSTRVAEAIAVWMELSTETQWQAQQPTSHHNVANVMIIGSQGLISPSLSS